MNRNIKKHMETERRWLTTNLVPGFFLGKSEPNSPGKEVETFFKGVGHIFLENSKIIWRHILKFKEYFHRW